MLGRILLITTAVLFVLGLGYVINGIESRDPGELVIWTQEQAAGRAVLDTLLEEYMAGHPGVKVSEIYYETEELRNNYIFAALGGRGPDLVFGPSDMVGPLDVLGIIRPLEDLLDSTFLARFIPDAQIIRKGRLLMIGDQVGNHLALVYNRKMVNSPPETMDDIIELSRRNREAAARGETDVKYTLVWNFVEPFFFIPFLGGYGGWVMDEEGNPTLDTEANERACQFIVDLRDKYGVIPKEADLDVVDALFKQGKAAMVINGPWSWGSYIQAGVDVGLTRIPRINETGLWPTPMVSAKGYCVNVNLTGVRLERVADLLRFLLRSESQLRFTAALATIPSHLEARQHPLVQENYLVRESMRQYEVGRLMPIEPTMRAIWDAMRPNYQRVLGGEMRPGEAAEAMQRDAEKLIRDMLEG